jgi:hypothetical protein
MWIPNRSAFRTGTVQSGRKSWDADSAELFSFASCINTLAKGKYSTATDIKLEHPALPQLQWEVILKQSEITQREREYKLKHPLIPQQ